MTVDVLIEEPRWADAEVARLAETAVRATLEHLALDASAWEVAVLACDDARIATLNADFRDKSTATNVLSWPSEDRAAAKPGKTPEPPEGDPALGDLAISFDTCLREAEASGISLENHATHLLVHGTLHLLGYDHENDSDADLMEATEIAILASLGVPNPYVG